VQNADPGPRQPSLVVTSRDPGDNEDLVFSFDQGVSPDFPAGIWEVKLIPATRIGSHDMTVTDLQSKDSAPVGRKPVAGMEKIEPVGIRPSAIQNATITFGVSGKWITSNNLTPDEIVLMRDVNGNWSELETNFVGMQDNTGFYQSVTPGFSCFAITVRQMTGPAPAPVPSITMTPEPKPSAPPAAITNPAAAIPAQNKSAGQTPFTPVQTARFSSTSLERSLISTPNLITSVLIGIAYLALLVAGFIIVRRWWIDRKNRHNEKTR